MLLFRAAAAAGRRLLSCAHALHYHSRIARLAPKVEGRSPSAMALFIIIDADADADAC